MTQPTLTRDEEIRQIHKDYTTFYQLGGGLLLVVIGVFIGALIFSDDSGYGTNIYTELLSVGLTIGVLNVLQERRDTRNRIKDLQEQLVREAGSPIHATAVSAIDTLRKRGWLGRKNIRNTTDDTESLLEKADLSNADLHGADLGKANLIGAILEKANLTSAHLEKANLTSTDLQDANLSGAYLVSANLTSTDLQDANLSGAQLGKANLSSAKLNKANLSNASLFQVNLSNVDLFQANLSNASLFQVNLSSANLWYANLSGANLFNVNLSNVSLGKANLSSTHLEKANLSSTKLWNANLSSANLWYANLSGANLFNANLTDALIQESTQFDEKTILPDYSKWSAGRNLAEFGAEIRQIVNNDWDFYLSTYTFTFADGVTRRWQQGKGWLDNRDGSPIEDNT